MRILILMRGIPGCGKSTFIKDNGLENYTLSSDKIRILTSSFEFTPDGNKVISQKEGKYVWFLLHDLLEKRMQQGALTVVDATNIKRQDVVKYKELAQKYRYRIYVIDFSDVDIELCKLRNKNREPYARVPESVIDRMAESLEKETMPGSFAVINHNDFNVNDLFKCIDLEEYDAVNIIGDIHGCYEPLKELFKDGVKENEFYIFCGDYLDRGIQNVEVLKFILPLASKKNFLFLEGNHEEHLIKWANEEVSCSPEFEKFTRPQLETANINTKDVRQFCRRLGQCAYFEYHGKKFSVTHGGLPYVPNCFTNTSQMIKGVGTYKDSEVVDNKFYDNYYRFGNPMFYPLDYDKTFRFYTVHGHRNINHVPIQSNDRAFNLEGAVEFGGSLRTIRITPDEIIPIEIKNTVFKKFDYGKINQKIPVNDIPAVVDAMRSTELVKEKKFGNISSFNFTRTAFENANWSDVTIKARGLFINTVTNKVCARGYEKFFKIDETKETELSSLKDNLVFPVTAMVKENGYLGILGYDEETDELVVCSKSMANSGLYAGYFKDLLYKTLSVEKVDELKDYLKNNNKGMVFEVIDIKNDPHIVEYDKSKIILLDILDRTVDFNKLPYEEMVDIANRFGFEYKTRAAVLNCWNEFAEWYFDVTSKEYQYNGANIEGFVLEDSSGFLFKVKSYYYNLWKFLRSVADSTLKNGYYRNTSKLNEPIEKDFYDWLRADYKKYQDCDIISLRKMFYQKNNKKG